MNYSQRILIASCLFLTSCHSNLNPNRKKKQLTDTSLVTPNSTAIQHTSTSSIHFTEQYYPFQLQEFDGEFKILANIEVEDLFNKYEPLFRKYGYSGNGYCWEGHITQILGKLDEQLLYHIDFDSEAGTFVANADNKENQLKFAKLLSTVFADTTKLEQWVKKADRSEIDD